MNQGGADHKDHRTLGSTTVLHAPTESAGSGARDLSTSQVARELGIPLTTVRRWADMGYLSSYRTPGGQRRFTVNDLERFVRSLQRHDPPAQEAAPTVVAREEFERAAGHLRLVQERTPESRAELEESAALLSRVAGQDASVVVDSHLLGDDGLQDAAREVQRLTEQLTPVDPPIPSEAVLGAARRNAQARWDFLQEVGYLTAEQVADGRSRATNRAAYASRLRRQRRVFGVSWHGRTLFPAFQFDAAGGPRAEISEILHALPLGEMTEWEIALWWTAANGWLHGGERPLDLLEHEPQLVVEAARREHQRPPA